LLADQVLEKILWAEKFNSFSKDELLRNPKISDLLIRLRAAIHGSRREMAGRGIAEICRECDQKEGGSCCGYGLEAYYDETLLLINLLLGVILPGERAESTSCFFLSANGCRLLARHVICINYVCEKITDRFHPQELAPLREKEGVEVELLFRLNEELKQAVGESRRFA
jgi:hypothetical protein